MPPTENKMITPPQLAKRWGVDDVKVIALIRAGQLRAINLAVNPNGRPRYRIYEEDIHRFETARLTVPYPRSKRLEEAKEWIMLRISNNPMRASKVEELAVLEGICMKTLKKAKAELGIASIRRGGEWFWVLLPEEEK